MKQRGMFVAVRAGWHCRTALYGVSLDRFGADAVGPFLDLQGRVHHPSTKLLRIQIRSLDPTLLKRWRRRSGLRPGVVMKQSLQDPSPMVRFTAGMAIGDVKYEPALPLLREMARHEASNPKAEPDKRVFCAIVYALHMMGDTSFTSELADMLSDGEKEVRANAAMVMGRMEEPSAVVPLKIQLADEQDPTVQLQVLESLAILGDEQSAIRLEAHTKTQYMEDRLVAIRAMEQVPMLRGGRCSAALGR